MKKGVKNKGLKLWQKIFIGLILGVVVGIILSNMGGPENATISKLMDFFAFLGNVFIRLIRMVVVPLVFFSITTGVINLGDIKRLAGTGIRSIVLFLLTSAGAVTIGLFIANIIKPGSSVQLGTIATEVQQEVAEIPSVYDVILDFFPENPVASMANGTMLQIIVFAIFVGIALIMLGERAKPVNELLSICSEAMFKVVDIVVRFTPLGVFGLMANATTQFGTDIFGPIFKFIIADYLSAILFTVIILWGVIIFGYMKLNPIIWFKKTFEPWLIAFSTCTSSAALPVNMKVAKKIGIPDENASFVLPVGATMNMNGTCIYFGLIVVFASQLYGADLSIASQVMLVLQATLLAVGCAAIPQIGLIISITLIESMGLPLEAVALVAGVYRIVDQIHTATNSHGDLVVAAMVSKMDRSFDYETYNKDIIDEDDAKELT